jgi:SAM-dependent methyltransferase
LYNRTCPVCGGDQFELTEKGVRDYEYLSPGEFDWLKCQKCDLTILDPMPTAEQLFLAYPSNYHSFQLPTSLITKSLLRFSRHRQARYFSTLINGKGRVLDIGCSTGELLKEIGKTGSFDLYGVEYDQNTAEVARSKGIKVQAGSFEDAELPMNHFTMVTMQHVLEHVTDPELTLRKNYQILESNGVLVGELPNIDSWDARLFGRFWGGGHTPRHIWHYSPDNLRIALEAAGFTEIKISSALHTGHWACSFQNLLRRNRFDESGLKNGRAWYYPFLLLACVPINLVQMAFLKTGIMRFECIKP